MARTNSRPLGTEHIPDYIAWPMRTAAVSLGAFAVVVFLLLASYEGAPSSGTLTSWEEPLQYAALTTAFLGYLIALRWEGAGGGIMLIGAIGLGVLASVEFEPMFSLAAVLAFLVPAVLFLLRWQRTQPLYSIASLAVVLTLLLAGGWYGADQIYSYYWGPTHPESSVELPSVDLVEWSWAGAVTSDGVTVNAETTHATDRVRLAVSESADFIDPVYSGFAEARDDETEEIVSMQVSGLDPDTAYYYAIEVDGRLDEGRRGSFRTFPEGASSFTFAVASCARTGSNGAVFDAIRSHNPLFYMMTGDFHYQNIDRNDIDAMLDAYGEQLTQPAQQALYGTTPVTYTWDDHDYGGDGSDSASPARPGITQAYRYAVPHYDLPSLEGAIYQAFSAGRVRFIVLDTRSERSPVSMPDGPDKTMLGAEQKAWLKEQLLAAADQYPLIVIVSSVPWIDKDTAGADTWAGYATERRELADFIAGNGIDGLLMLNGDAHMVAIDDGTNSDYSTNGGAAFPVLHAAPLDKRGSEKGGPFSEGAYQGSGQFGLVTVEDSGTTISVTLSGRDYEDEEIVGYEFTVPEQLPRSATTASGA